MDEILASIALTGLVILAGCGFIETVEQPQAEIEFNGTINTTGDEFHIDGEIRDSFEFEEENTYRDVVLCVYDENRTLLHETPAQDLSPSSPEINVSMSVDTVPEFVIINSSDFWNEDSDIEVEYYVYGSRNGETRLYSTDVEDPESLSVQGCTA